MKTKFIFLSAIIWLFCQSIYGQQVYDKTELGHYKWSQLTGENAMKYDVEKVVRIEMFDVEEFPLELLKYTELRELEIYNSNFEIIPDRLLELKRLERLLLYNNKALVSIPSTILDLPNFRYLYIYNAPISSFPKITKDHDYSNLVFLDFALTNIKEIPDDILLLKNLNHLGVHGGKGYTDMGFPSVTVQGKLSQLSEIPSQVGELPNLESIDFSYSLVKNLPSKFINYNNLTNIYVQETLITEIPQFLKDLKENISEYSIRFSFTKERLKKGDIKYLKKNYLLDKSRNRVEHSDEFNFGRKTMWFIDIVPLMRN